MEINSSPAYVINGDKFDPVNANEDVAAIRKYYAELGFFDVTVKPTVQYSKDRKSISLEYAVHEGVHYKIRNFRITSNVPFKADELLRISKTHEGQFCDGFQIRKELKRFEKQYVASGFTPLNVKIQSVFPSEQPGLVDVSVRVWDENKKGDSLPSAPAQASNGDTRRAPRRGRRRPSPKSRTSVSRKSKKCNRPPATTSCASLQRSVTTRPSAS